MTHMHPENGTQKLSHMLVTEDMALEKIMVCWPAFGSAT